MYGLVNSMQATTPIKIQYEQYGFQPHSMKPQNKLALSQASHANVRNTPSQILLHLKQTLNINWQTHIQDSQSQNLDTPNVALTLTKQTNSQFIDGSLVQPKRNHQTIWKNSLPIFPRASSSPQ